MTAFLAVVGVAGWMFFQDQVRTKLCSTLQTKCNEVLEGTGVKTSIGNAQFYDGEGMLLSNMRATAPNVALTAYETFIAMDSSTTDLVTGKCKVNGIEMRRVQLELFRDADGSIDFSPFTKVAASIEAAAMGRQKRPVPIAMLDSQVRLIDQSAGIDKTISDINFRITPVVHEGRQILQIVAAAASTEVQQVVLKGFVDPKSGEWNADLALDNASVDGGMLSLLPSEVRSRMGASTTFSSRVDGSFQANGNWRSNQLHWFEGNGKVAEISVGHQRLPSDIRDASANFYVDPNGARCEQITGYMGFAPFAARFSCVNLLRPQSWNISGRINQFKLDQSRETISAMPPSAHQFLNDFKPRGLFDIGFDLGFDGTRLKRTIKAKISQLAFNFDKFPYPMSDCEGSASWIDDQISYELKSHSNDRVLTASGFVNNPGKHATWRCDLNVERGQLPFDEKLQTAIDANPAIAKTVRAFNAHGWIAGSGTLQKPVPGGEVQKQFDIDVVDLTMRHSRFPYSIENVKGKITSINKSFWFKQLTGTDSSGTGRILCNGTWNQQSGLKARYVCNEIELDDGLRRALRAELKEVWDGFRPRGTIEMMTVDMTMLPDQKECNLVLDSTLNGESDGKRTSDLSIFPTWFPYRLDNLAGKLVVGDGKVQLRNFQGQHGRTIVSCNGDGAYSSEGWDMSLTNLLTRSLRVDQPLLTAMPESLARPVQYMKFDGLLNVNGTMTLAGQYRKPQLQYASAIPNHGFPQTPHGSFVQRASAAESIENAPRVSMGWDLRFDMNQAEMFLGIPVKNVFGMFELIGQFDGDNVECRGTVDLDSLTIYDAQITNISGPVWFDNYQALAGGMINELSTGRSSPSITGEMYGGKVQLDAAISSDREGRFVIQTTLADGNLKELSQEFSPGLEDVEGRTFAALKMQGDASGTHTCRGNGQIHVRDAKIYELPPVMRLLKLLQVRRLNDVAFDSGDIFFVVNGENIDINRMEFNGDAISIIGNGRMNMDHDLDLNFYSVMGRNKINIPLISDLYRRSSQKFMWINVGGTCQNPKISKEILPELNDSLRQLFQQNERQAEGTVYQSVLQR